MRLKRVLIAIIAFVMAVSVVYDAIPASAYNGAGGAPGGNGYFWNRAFRSPGYNVIEGGLPSYSYSSKQAFINYIIGRINSTAEAGPCPGSGCDYAGVRFIVQTMRGGLSGGWDHDYPDQNDINDWVARVNNPDVDIRYGSEGALFGSGITTDRYRDSAGKRDIAVRSGSTAGATIVFYSISTERPFYMIRIACGNPLGANYPGLPDPVNYTLSPVMTGSPSSSEGGGTATLTPVVNNTGTTNSASAEWQATAFTVPAGQTVPGGADNGTIPTTYYGFSGVTIGSGNQVFVRNNNTLTVPPQSFADAPAGTRYCYALSVRPLAHNNSNWRHGTPFCIVITKKPKVQVTGGDLYVGVGTNNTLVRTSTSIRDTNGVRRIFGSWGEYGVFTSGTVRGFGSGSAFSGGLQITSTQTESDTVCRFSLLSFANTTQGDSRCDSATVVGGFTSVTTLPVIGSQFSTTSAPTTPASFAVNSLSSGRVYTTANNATITITGGSLSKGQWLVINAPTATVNITGNITYTNDVLNSLDDIPQLIVIANNINIAGSVSRIDGWLVASGTAGAINTCSDVATNAALTAVVCNQQLMVNGPVLARQLFLRRTFNTNDPNVPAEVFNLRPDAYLWGIARISEGGRLQTTYMHELPPRF